ncbi:trypsin-like peptidase domain-containing protein [Parasediminibacterium sp. JCM 36343]|uniref:trypsin-like peptidase domain-containing protein n=1 Tax=Parasediminibacterium sp. JCM 36343 TaxID=3374279 RepID=UPI00397CCFBA
MNLKNILTIVGISATTTLISVFGYTKIVQNRYASVQEPGKIPANYAGFFGNNNSPLANVDFTAAATSATPAVVHIKTKTKEKRIANTQKQVNPFGDMFGGGMFDDFFNGPKVIPEQRASGSGVIISEDGLIVTNNHVVDGADEINITLPNKKSYKGTVVGTDPSSDIAVVKIEAKGLPYLVYGNSDDAKLGQWVLAIGYPLNLDVTVTAGIVSAKSRSININTRQSATPVESFIQTDAAVNPGNSGGALINTNGELIGINSAIASPTGSYAGYSYAIPVNIVKKVVNDIVKFGTVQRAFVGISYPMEGISEEEKAKQGIKDVDGVYVMETPVGGAANAAGIKKGDVVTKINGVTVTTGPEMVEQVSRYKPGDKITITYTRDGKENTVSVVLKNKGGNTDVVKNESILDQLGADLQNVDKKIASANDIAGGVLVKKIKEGLLKATKMQDGFVITSVNDVEIKTVDDLKAALTSAKGNTVRLLGIYPGFQGTYAYPLSLAGE